MKIYIGIIFFLFTLEALAQGDLDTRLKGNQKQLDRVRQEMNTLRQEIAKTDIRASSTLEQIKILDREVALLNKSRRLLTQETQLLSKKIYLTREQLQISRRKFQSLKDQYAKRVVHLYKYGKLYNLELLTNSASINQALVRYKYLKFFNDQEKHILQKIKSNMNYIADLELGLSQDFQNQRQVIQQQDVQRSKYLVRKNEKKTLVRKLQWNSQDLNKQLKSAEEEYQKLYQLIVTLEKQRQLRERSGDTKEEYALNLKDFKKNRGKLPWPVKGTIINKYGKQYNSKLKTTINNTGIDIKAKSGTEVRSVSVGVVSMITYLSGFGNTVILDHGEGYYTVYSHLEEFFVEPDELVPARHVIGLVGDSGSLEGAKLHFAIFCNQRTENPQNWIK